MLLSALVLSPGRAAVSVAILAFVLRLLVLGVFLPDRVYTPEEEAYFREAQAMTQGHWLGLPEAPAPGMSYFMAGGLGLGLGRDGLQVVQAGLGALAAALTLVLATQLFGIRIGLMAGGAAALYPYLLYLPTVFAPQNALIPLLLFVPTALYHRQGGGGRWWALAAGIALGLAVGFMTAMLLVVPAFILWHVVSIRSRRRRVVESGLLGAGALLILIPLLARNVALEHRWYSAAAVQDLIRAWQSLRLEPDLSVQRFALRMGALWAIVPGASAGSPQVGSGMLFLIAVTSAPVVLLGLGGMLFFVPRWRLLLPLYAAPLLLTLGLSFFETTVRYRLTFEPYLLILAAATLVRLLRPRALGGWVGHGLAARLVEPSSST